ncbi:MAG TPA: DUF2157 domain-containing protein [Cytophagaceae bacterium]|jgi:hypothetical protein|nr:DUF2157 domain-containing protein [Cytophagaceae bacterium]
MKSQDILTKLNADELLTPEEHQRLKQHFDTKLFSVHWELKTILYLGVMLLSTGLGIFIYLNIDTIGHTAIVSIIGFACAACFGYCYKNRKPFTWEEVTNDHPFADYILLLGCLLFLSFEGYLQFQYTIFGTRYGMAALIPTILFFFIAYRFDHKGILSMAITGLGGWLGLTITPLTIFEQDFGTASLIYTGVGLGAFLTLVSYYIRAKDLKKHFSFSYFNFGMQLLFVCTLSGIFSIRGLELVFYILLAGLCYLSFVYARKEQSFYFLLMSALYGYVGVTNLFIRWIMSSSDSDAAFSLALLYFILSCIGIIYFFFNYKKFLKS